MPLLAAALLLAQACPTHSASYLQTSIHTHAQCNLLLVVGFTQIHETGQSTQQTTGFCTCFIPLILIIDFAHMIFAIPPPTTHYGTRLKKWHRPLERFSELSFAAQLCRKSEGFFQRCGKLLLKKLSEGAESFWISLPHLQKKRYVPTYVGRFSKMWLH